MYLIGELRDGDKAKEISQELLKRDIVTELRYSSDQDLWGIFILDETRINEAHDFYRVKLGLKKPIELEQEWIEIKKIPTGFFTKIFIFISVVLFLLSYSELGNALYSQLMFSEPKEVSLFSSIKVGEVYRFLTPIFLHMSILHILFNMLWFKDLASLLEDKFSIGFFFFFSGFTGMISNLLQYLVAGPRFGGMSGVLYALLGFFWIYKKSHRGFEFGIPDRDMKIMLFWFVLCLTGFLGPIANLAHAGGLTLGMMMALLVNRNAMSYTLGQQIKVFFIALFILLATIFIEGFKLKGDFYFQKDLRNVDSKIEKNELI